MCVHSTQGVITVILSSEWEKYTKRHTIMCGTWMYLAHRWMYIVYKCTNILCNWTECAVDALTNRTNVLCIMHSFKCIIKWTVYLAISCSDSSATYSSCPHDIRFNAMNWLTGSNCRFTSMCVFSMSHINVFLPHKFRECKWCKSGCNGLK